MALKIRQKKQKTQPSIAQYSSYVGAKHGRHWAEQYQEDNQQSVRKSFVAIVVVMVVIVLILIFSAVTTFTSIADTSTQITAADTFAITSYEQDQMKEAATTFADGVLVYAYCSDDNVAMQGKTAALRQMATNTSSYAKIEQLSPVSAIIAPENFAPVVTEPVLQNPTMAYAGDFSWEFDAVAADTSVVSEANPNGTFADAGYHFKVTFSSATDESTGDIAWVITNVDIQAK